MNNIVIVKSGSLFSTLSHIGNNDLVLDENVSIELYNNASISIGNNIYYYGPITNISSILNNDRHVILEHGIKYHINNINLDPIGFTKKLELSQKVIFNTNTSIILPSETILHTADNLLEFKLTKAIHCTVL